MRIVEPYARLMPPPHVDLSDGWKPFEKEHGLQLLRRVEWCARISHRSEEKQIAESYNRFLQTWVMEHGDFSTIEHCVISADLVVDRGLSHELVRHRLAAYTQESTRFCNYGKNSEHTSHILPPHLFDVHTRFCSDRHISPDDPIHLYIEQDEVDRGWVEPNIRHYHSWLRGVILAEREYMYQVKELKVAPEIARDMLPHCLAVRMVMTHNLRNWRHLMIMRTTNETHRKLRPLMQDLLVELKEKVPVLFADLEPDQKQSKNLQKGR